MRQEKERGGAARRELSVRAKGHCWRFSPEGKSAANGAIINVWRFEFLNPTTPPLCPKSTGYNSCTKHMLKPIKVSIRYLKLLWTCTQRM